LDGVGSWLVVGGKKGERKVQVLCERYIAVSQEERG